MYLCLYNNNSKFPIVFATIMASIAAEISELIELSKDSCSQAWDKLEQLLVEKKYAWKSIVDPDLLLVHPFNRAGSGVSYKVVHALGEKILFQGCSMQALQQGVCFEMSRDPNKMMADIAFNNELVQRSNGMLAKVSGNERFLTVAGSHAGMFMKAKKALIYTSDEVEAMISKDKVFNDCLAKGYEFLIVAAEIYDRFPEVVKICSQAKNASQNVSSRCSEMEVALRLTQGIADYSKNGEVTSTICKEILQKSLADVPECRSYAPIIMEYCQKFSGGVGGSLISFLSKFSQQFAEDAILGEEMWNCICKANFKDPACLFVYTRHWLILCCHNYF